MAVGSAMQRDEWCALAEASGWKVVARLDLSDQVLPNLVTFEELALRFLRRNRLARLVTRISRSELLENVIAGYLMAQTVRDRLHTYEHITLRAK